GGIGGGAWRRGGDLRPRLRTVPRPALGPPGSLNRARPPVSAPAGWAPPRPPPLPWGRAPPPRPPAAASAPGPARTAARPSRAGTPRTRRRSGGRRAWRP